MAKGSHFSQQGGRTPNGRTPNTTDPFSPDYVDPAISNRQRRRAERRRARNSEQGGNGKWNLLYVIAALIITVLVWFLFGGGI